MTRKITNRPEQDLQIMCVNYFRLQHKDKLIFAVPNSAKRGAIEGARMKAMGTLKGCADVVILSFPGKATFIEMKSGKGKQQPSQMAFQDAVEKLGFTYYICDSFDRFKKIVGAI